jgi:hypothetical protein
MPKYDPNLPREFSRLPKKRSNSLFIALLIAAVFLLSAFLSWPRSKTPLGDNVAATQQERTLSEKLRQPPG